MADPLDFSTVPRRRLVDDFPSLEEDHPEAPAAVTAAPAEEPASPAASGEREFPGPDEERSPAPTADIFDEIAPRRPAPSTTQGFRLSALQGPGRAFFGQEIEAEQASDKTAQKKAEADAKRQSAELRRLQAEERARVRSTNAQIRSEASRTGQLMQPDAGGRLQPVLDEQSGQPLFKERAGKVGYDERGRAVQPQQDRFGRVRLIDPDANAKIGGSDDPNDPNLYRQNKYQGWDTLGHVEDLRESKDPAVRQAAEKHAAMRQKLVAKASLDAATRTLGEAETEVLQKANTAKFLEQKIAARQAEFDRAAEDPALKEREGGFLGIGSSETPRAAVLRQQQEQREKELTGMREQLAGVRKAGEEAEARRDLVRSDAQAWRHSIELDNHSNLAAQRRAYLQRTGGNVENDPVLRAIGAKEEQIGTRLSEARKTQEAAQARFDAIRAQGAEAMKATAQAPTREEVEAEQKQLTAARADLEARATDLQKEAETFPSRQFTSPAEAAAARDDLNKRLAAMRKQQDLLTESAANTAARVDRFNSETLPREQYAAAAAALKQSGQPAGPAPKIGAGEQFAKSLQDLAFVPFVGSAKEVYDAGSIAWKAWRVQEALKSGQEPDLDDLKAVKAFQDESSRESTFGAKVVNLVMNAPGFAGEFMFTGGLATLGKEAGVKALSKAASWMATGTARTAIEAALAKQAARLAGVKVAEEAAVRGGAKALEFGVKGALETASALARMPAVAPLRVAGDTIKGMLPQFEFKGTGDAEKLAAEVKKPGLDFLTSVSKATRDQFVEILSEGTGGALKYLPGAEKMAAAWKKLPLANRIESLKLALASQVSKDGQRSVDAFLKAGGFHGVVAEMFEERVGEAMKAGLNVAAGEPSGYKKPTMEQLAVEALGFGIFGGAMGAVGRAQQVRAEKRELEAGAGALAAMRQESAALTPENVATVLALPAQVSAPGPDGSTPAGPVIDDAGTAAQFEKRTGQKVPPEVVASARELSPPDMKAEDVLGRLEQARALAAQADEARANGDRVGAIEAQREAIAGFQQVEQQVRESDQRIAAAAEIAGLPDYEAPEGQPANPGYNRDLVRALAKISQGQTIEQLTAAERETIEGPTRATANGVPLVSGTGKGLVITDAAIGWLGRTAPAVRALVRSSEQERIRQLSAPAAQKTAGGAGKGADSGAGRRSGAAPGAPAAGTQGKAAGASSGSATAEVSSDVQTFEVTSSDPSGKETAHTVEASDAKVAREQVAAGLPFGHSVDAARQVEADQEIDPADEAGTARVIERAVRAAVRSEGQQVTAKRAASVSSVAKRLASGLSRWSGVLKSVGYRVALTSEARNSGGALVENGTVVFSAADLFRSAGDLNKSEALPERIVLEEAIHAVALQSGIDTEAIWRALPASLQARVLAVYGEPILNGEMSRDWFLGHEFLRMAVQGRIQMQRDGIWVAGEMTEAMRPSLWTAMRKALAKLVKAFRDIAAKLQRASIRAEDLALVNAAVDRLVAVFQNLDRSGPQAQGPSRDEQVLPGTDGTDLRGAGSGEGRSVGSEVDRSVVGRGGLPLGADQVAPGQAGEAAGGAEAGGTALAGLNNPEIPESSSANPSELPNSSQQAEPTAPAAFEDPDWSVPAEEPADEPAPPAASAPRGARTFRGTDIVRSDLTPLTNLVAEAGGIRPLTGRSKEARGRASAEYEGWNLLPLWMRKQLAGRLAPDVALAQLIEAGMMRPNASVDDMWAAVQREQESATRLVADAKNQAGQARDFEAAAVERAGGTGQPVVAGTLAPGTVVMIDGEPVRVREVDDEAGIVTFQDGTRFGRQQLDSGETIYVESIEPPPAQVRSRPTAQENEELQARANRSGAELVDPLTGDDTFLASRLNGRPVLFSRRSAAEDPNQAGFDFWTLPSVSEREQRGLDFTPGAPATAAAEQEAPAAAAIAQMSQAPAPAEEVRQLLPLDAPTSEPKPATPRGIVFDFGEKIGGARKDTARPLGPRGSAPKAPDDSRPAWRRKYTVVPETRRDYVRRESVPTGRWRIERTDGARVRHGMTYASAAEAEAVIPLVEVTRNHVVMMRYGKGASESTPWSIMRRIGERKLATVKSGFATEAEGRAYLATHPEEIIEHKFIFPERPWLDRLQRRGGRPRTGDVTPDMFQRDFGFRGGEFGNWNAGRDGQAALNAAFDALHDFADILGVSPKALSLNGDLAIAFGARGKGGEGAAAAHYEPGLRVINLTKIKGAGSLAHEWFHAFDHYLGMQDGRAADRLDAALNTGRDADKVRATYVSHGFSHRSNVRAELREAFQRVIDTMTAQTVEREVPSEQLQKIADRQSEWLRETVKGVRERFTSSYNKRKPTADQLREFDALAERIGRGEAGEVVRKEPGPSAGRFSIGRKTFAAVEELNTLFKKVTGYSFSKFGFDNLGARLDGQIRSFLDAAARVESAQLAAAKEVRKVATEFLTEARAIDEMRAEDYWSTPHEMAARAFEQFVATKLESSERANDYLVSGADNRAYALLGLKPYPEGAEAERIGAAWQKVFDTIQEKTTDRGAALYSRPSADAARPVDVEAAVRDQRVQSLRTIRALRAKQQASQRLTAGEQEEMLRAEKSLGQSFAFDMEEAQRAAKRQTDDVPFALDRQDDFRPQGEQLTLFSRPAPNGAASNLDADDYALVRTPEFKAWFGDWELVAQRKALTGPPVARVAMGTIQAAQGEKASDAAKRWLEQNPQDSLSRPGLGRVVFDDHSIDTTLGHGFSGPKLNALAAVPEVIRAGVELDASMDWEGKPLHNRILAAPISLGDRRHTLFARLRADTADPESLPRFYVHEAVLEDHVANEKASPFKSGSDPEVFRGKKSGGTGFYLSLARRALAVNPEQVFTALDENGEPLPRAINLFKKGLLPGGAGALLSRPSMSEVEEASPFKTGSDPDGRGKSSGGAGSEVSLERGARPVNVDEAAHEAATSPRNDAPEPSAAQREAGNFRMGHVRMGGLDISIEHPAGTRRKPEWKRLTSHYGYIRGAQSRDGENLDVFIRPGTPADYPGPVFVVNQTREDGTFDEHKAVIGEPTEARARLRYLSNYPAGWKLGTITEFPTVADFRQWLDDGDMRRPAVLARQSGLEADIAELMRELDASADFSAIDRERMKSTGRQPGPLTNARPDLALSTLGPDIMAVDSARGAAADEQTFEQWDQTADEALARNYAGAKSMLVKSALAGLQLSAIQTRMAQKIVAREVAESSTPERRRELQALIYGYRMTGTEQARALAARRDPFKTPAERHREFLARMLYTPPAAQRTKLADPALSKVERDRLLSEDLKRVERIEAELAKMGVTADEIFRGEVELVLKGSRILQNAADGLSERDREVLKRWQGGAMSAEDIAKATGVSVAQAKATKRAFMDKLRARLEAKVRGGATVESLAREESPALLAASVSPEPARQPAKSDAEVAAEVKRMLEAMGFFESDKPRKVRKGKRKTVLPPPTAPAGQPQTRVPDPVGGGEIPDFGPIPTEQPPLIPDAAPTSGREPAPTPVRVPTDDPVGPVPSVPPADMFEKPPAKPGDPNAPRTWGDKMLWPEAPPQTSADVSTAVDLTDPGTVYKVARVIQAANSNAFDQVLEFWINNILSGPQTQVANIAGNAISTVWEYSIQRGTEALLNLAYGDAKGAQVGEFRILLKSLVPGIARGWQMAKLSWDSEADLYEQKTLSSQTELRGFEDAQDVRASIGGTTGRIVRMPSRALQAADAFFKFMIGQMEAGGQAFRIAKAEGLSGAALESRIRGLVATPGSEAWIRSLDKVLDLTFQTPLRTTAEGGTLADDVVAQMARVRQGAGTGAKLLSFVLPFIRTPYNIFRTGIRKTPLGMFSLLNRLAQAGFYRLKDGKPVFESFSKAEQVKAISEQLIAGALMGLLYWAVEGDGADDDDKKFLITGSRPFTVDRQGQKDLVERAFGGSRVIRIGGRDGVLINYGRYEPFATVISTMADTIRIAKASAHGATFRDSLERLKGYFLSQVQEKTFLQGLSDMTKALGREGSWGEKAQRALLTGIVPNLIRQPLRNLDDYERDGRGGSLLEGAAYKALPAGGLAEKRYDATGGDSKKQGAGSPLRVLRLLFPPAQVPDDRLTKFDQMLLNWNRDNPGRIWAPQAPNRKYRDVSTGKEKEMTSAEYAEFSRRSGAAAMAALTGVINSGNARRPTEADVNEVKKAFLKAHQQVREQMFETRRAGKPTQPLRPAPPRGADLATVFGWN